MVLNFQALIDKCIVNFVSEYLVFEEVLGNLKGQRGLCLQPTLQQLRKNNNVCACMCFQTDLQYLNLGDLQEKGMVRISGVPRERVLPRRRWSSPTSCLSWAFAFFPRRSCK